MAIKKMQITWQATEADGRTMDGTRLYFIFDEEDEDSTIIKFATDRLARQLRIPQNTISITNIDRNPPTNGEA